MLQEIRQIRKHAVQRDTCLGIYTSIDENRWSQHRLGYYLAMGKGWGGGEVFFFRDLPTYTETPTYSKSICNIRFSNAWHCHKIRENVQKR